ncbi:MAG: hypothetical protein IKO47_07270 [Ruminococcus sp.]|nr:hypothetical protein [Ruminococcus sp.]
MFRKAQFRLFAIITGILLAVFIAVLGSLNIIMQSVMQRQSKDVLKKIAAGVEYDDNTSSFRITRPEDFGQKPVDEPPFKPGGQPGSDFVPPSTEPETVSDTTGEDTTAATTEQDKVTDPSQTSPPQTVLQTQAVTTTSAVTTAPAETSDIPTVSSTATAPPQPPSDDHERDKDKDKGREKETENETQAQGWPPGGWWGQDQPPFYPPWFGGGYGQEPFQPHFWNPWDQGGQQPSSEKTSQENPCWKGTASTPEEFYGAPTALGLSGGVLSDDGDSMNDRQSGGNNNAPQRRDEQIPKSLGSIDFFIVMADKDGSYLAKLNDEDLTSDEAQSYITAILKEDVSSGMIDKKYQFYQMEKNNGTIIVFTDKSAEINVLNKLFRTTIIIGVISLIVLAAAAFFLSRQVMKPLRSAFEKQKQFISDASHELKTPLTVISANADVLSGEIGDNKWLTYIKSQAERMNVLVNDLLNLTRLENNTSDFIRTDFDISKAIVNTALPFECQAFESNKKFDVDVDEGLTVNGSERHIKQMAAIFIDNALKYSGEGGTVKVSLKRQGERKVLTVFNTGNGVKEGEEEKIFERFYRSDESRNRSTGGYGLGLAIAKSIIDKHKFKVHVDNHEGKSIAFVITM